MSNVIRALAPDTWSGWRWLDDGSIDFSLGDPEYLKARGEYFDAEIKGDASSLDIFNLVEQDKTRKVLAWGPGSGKTTKLKLFCAKYHREGIICVFRTKEEIEHFAFDVKSINSVASIAKFHSGSSRFEDFKSNPSAIRDYGVLCCTYKTMLRYNSHDLFMMDDIFYSMSNHGGRQFIFFDEFPTLYEKIDITADYLESKQVDFDKAVGDLHTVSDFRKLDADLPLREYFRFIYETLISGAVSGNVDKVNEFKRFTGIKECTELSKASLAARLKVGIDRYIEEDGNLKNFSITLNDFKIPHMFIVDGTSDLLFESSTEWVVDKKFDPTLKLSNMVNFDESIKVRGTDLDTQSSVNTITDKILEATKGCKSPLIVSWKSAKSSDLLIEDNKTTSSDVKHDLVGMLQRKLPDNYQFTYYQSGETRATNKFIDCDCIVLVGEFHIPSWEMSNIKRVVGSSCSNLQFYVAEAIQTIFRTRARRNEEIDLVTFGLSRRSIHEILTYCNTEYNVDAPIDAQIKNSIMDGSLKVYENLRDKLITIADNLDKFNVVDNRTLEISLSDIHTLGMYKKKESYRYESVVRELSNIGITLKLLK